MIPSRPTGAVIVSCGLWVAAFPVGCSDPATPEASDLNDLPDLTLVEEIRIGSLDDPDVGFTRIGDVQVSPVGEVYVSERAEMQVRVYGVDGRPLRSYGGQGEGPGEFRSIGSFGLVGDTLWVNDGVLHLTTLFLPDGSLLGTVSAVLRVPIGEMVGVGRTVDVYPHALRSDGLLESTYARTVYPSLPDSVVEVPRVRFDKTGRVVDTLEMMSVLVSRPAHRLEFENHTAWVYPEPPASDSGSYEVELDSDTFSVRWSVDGEPATGSLSVALQGRGGDVRFRSLLRYHPRPVTARYLDSVAASRVGRAYKGRDSVQMFEAARSALQRPDHHRPVQVPTAPGHGSIWMKLDPDDPGSTRWLVFVAHRRLLGVVTLPQGAIPKWTDDEDVWLAERDGFDVPWLVRYRIVIPEE